MHALMHVPAMFRVHGLLKELVGEMQVVSDIRTEALMRALNMQPAAEDDASKHELRIEAINRELDLIERINPRKRDGSPSRPDIPPFSLDGFISLSQLNAHTPYSSI